DPAHALPVRHGELIELVAVPVEVRLPLATAGDDVHPFGATRAVGAADRHRGLVIARRRGIHAEMKRRIRRAKDVSPGRETPGEGGTLRTTRTSDATAIVRPRRESIVEWVKGALTTPFDSDARRVVRVNRSQIFLVVIARRRLAWAQPI